MGSIDRRSRREDLTITSNAAPSPLGASAAVMTTARRVAVVVLVAVGLSWSVVTSAAAEDTPLQAPPSSVDPAPTSTTVADDRPSTTVSTTTPTTTTVDGDDRGGSPGDAGDGTDSEVEDETEENFGRPTPTTVTEGGAGTSGADPGNEDPVNEDPAVSSSQPNPLLVAGPSDGRRQIPETTADNGAADDAPAPTEPPPAAVTDDAEVKVRRVVWGLIGLAVFLTGLAVYYWWITRPGPRSVAPPTEESSGGGTVDPWLTDSTSTR